MQDDVTTGKNLAAMRSAAGLSQLELAERVGVAQQTIAKIEKGTRALKYSEAVLISAALKVPISALAATEAAAGSSAKLLETMARIDRLEPYNIGSRAKYMAPALVRLACLVEAIESGRIEEPDDWIEQRQRVDAYLQTDWGADVFNTELTREVRLRCIDLGLLAEIAESGYIEILARVAADKTSGADDATS